MTPFKQTHEPGRFSNWGFALIQFCLVDLGSVHQIGSYKTSIVVMQWGPHALHFCLVFVPTQATSNNNSFINEPPVLPCVELLICCTSTHLCMQSFQKCNQSFVTHQSANYVKSVWTLILWCLVVMPTKHGIEWWELGNFKTRNNIFCPKYTGICTFLSGWNSEQVHVLATLSWHRLLWILDRFTFKNVLFLCCILCNCSLRM